jgi:tetratricopeptide (TPR) repeat protein
VEEFKENLREISQLVSSVGAKTLLLTAPSSFSVESQLRLERLGYMLPGDDPEGLHQIYQRAVRTLVRLPNVKILDLAEAFQKAAANELLLMKDGIHPSDLGHVAIAELLKDFIANHYLGAPRLVRYPAALALGAVAKTLGFAGQWEKSLELYRRSLQIDPDSQNLRLGLVWLLATCPVDSLRNGTEALAFLASEEPDPASAFHFLDVKAAALAETGRFAEAVALAQEALNWLSEKGYGSSEMGEAIQQRLDLYKVSKPMRLPTVASTSE